MKTTIKSAGMIAALVSTLCLTAGPVGAQSAAPAEDKMALARELTEVLELGERDYFSVFFKMVSKESDELVVALTEEMDWDELGEKLIPVYARHMSAAELRAAIDYYSSEKPLTEAGPAPELPQEVEAVKDAWREEELPRARDALVSRDIDSPVLDKARLGRTVADMRTVGVALMSWLVDRARGGEDSFDIEGGTERASWQIRASSRADSGHAYSVVPYSAMRELLVPKYLDTLPEKDGWGQPYQYAINADLRAMAVLGMRSPGKDGKFDTDDYFQGPFDIDAYEKDIVWVDGYLGRWPARPEAAAAPAGSGSESLGEFRATAEPAAQGGVLVTVTRPGDAIRAYNDGTKAYQSGDYEAAEDYFRAAVEIDPSLADAFMALATIHLREGSYAKAAQMADELLTLRPDDRQALEVAYKAHRVAGDDARAEALRSTLAELAVEAFNDGRRALQEGNLDTALEKFESALELDPQLTAAYEGIAWVYYNRHQYLGALATVNKLLALYPEHVGGRHMRFIIHDARRDPVAASAAFELYLESETNPKRLAAYAHSAFRQDGAERAEKALLRALEIAPSEPPVHYLLGLVYAAAEPAKAKKHLRRFLELAPDDPEAATAKEMLDYL